MECEGKEFGAMYHIREISLIPSERVDKLLSLSITTTRDFLCAARTFEGRRNLAALVGVSVDQVLEWAIVFELMRAPGIGIKSARILVANGISSVEDLREALCHGDKRLPSRVRGRLRRQREAIMAIPPLLITENITHVADRLRYKGYIGMLVVLVLVLVSMGVFFYVYAVSRVNSFIVHKAVIFFLLNMSLIMGIWMVFAALALLLMEVGYKIERRVFNIIVARKCFSRAWKEGNRAGLYALRSTARILIKVGGPITLVLMVGATFFLDFLVQQVKQFMFVTVGGIGAIIIISSLFSYLQKMKPLVTQYGEEYVKIDLFYSIISIAIGFGVLLLFFRSFPLIADISSRFQNDVLLPREKAVLRTLVQQTKSTVVEVGDNLYVLPEDGESLVQSMVTFIKVEPSSTVVWLYTKARAGTWLVGWGSLLLILFFVVPYFYLGGIKRGVFYIILLSASFLTEEWLQGMIPSALLLSNRFIRFFLLGGVILLESLFWDWLYELLTE